MNRSVLIEVDESTKSILELLEEKISKGTDGSLQSFQAENKKTLESKTKQILTSITNIIETVSDESRKLENRLDDVYDDVEEELHSVKENITKVNAKHLKTTESLLEDLQNKISSYVAESVSEIKRNTQGINTSTEKLLAIEKFLYEKINDKLEGSINSIIQQVIETIKEQGEISFEDITKKVAATDEKITKILSEGMAVISNKLEDLEKTNENIKSEIKEINSKLTTLQSEIRYTNMPFYKKWFGKRGGE